MAMRLDSRGYTLTEAMLVVGILGILAATAAPIIVQVTNFWRQTSARNDIQRDVRSSLDMINRFLRQADKKTVLIDQLSGQPPYSRITFTTESSQSVKFWQEGNTLKVTVTSGTATTSVLSSRLGYVAFTYPRTDDTSIISVAMTMQAPTYLGGKKALQLSISKVRIMN